MSARENYDGRTIKAKKPAVPASLNPGPSGPTTFFLRSEADIVRGSQRGRRASRKSVDLGQDVERVLPPPKMEDSTMYGVESLADTIAPAEASMQQESARSDTNTSDTAFDVGAAEHGLLPHTRRARNPVHPTIRATGRRILSNEQHNGQASPASTRSSESPFRPSIYRRGSATSSINLTSEPMTPLKMSPRLGSALPSTPRSGSPKSLRLSDEEASITDESGSQAVESSNEDEDLVGDSKTVSMPLLVMPSIAMPVRRPFTERGKRMGRLKVLVMGPAGSGKTGLINSIFRVSQDVVHVDPPTSSSVYRYGDCTEAHASTKPLPAWRSENDNRRALARRKSVGEGVLERNLCFIEAPSIDEDDEADHVSKYFDDVQQRATRLDQVPDGELIAMLSGDGGVQIDAVLWLLTSTGLDSVPVGLLKKLCQFSNVIPLLAQSDRLAADELHACKQKIRALFQQLAAQPYSFDLPGGRELPYVGEGYIEPLAVSSATADDGEEIDASILMSSQYMAPLMPSELAYLAENLLDPDNIVRMRHLSATKSLIWRHQHQVDLRKQMVLHSPHFGHTLQSASPSVTSTGSLLEEPSKILVPHSTSSFYRSASPSASDSSAPSGHRQQVPTYALTHNHEQNATDAPFREMRLAKWATDLQRSLRNENRRYQEMYTHAPADWSNNIPSDDEKALALTGERRRPARGRLGGDIAIIDPRDPLGVLALSQNLRLHGVFALQIAGGVGLIGAVAWWVTRNWAEVQEWFGLPGQVIVSQPAVPAPEKGLFGEFEGVFGRAFGGIWEKGMTNARRMLDVLSF
ncbi:Septin GTPase family [Teratosphaeria destructans]|uniref:Septin GTPase family n=1 Tax=Teratosphaeria destructans TaxID=418781 RepID=A0A9W7SN08_9PEZI|nr:Septin GTPase family [Teratosphaeria destructans]